MASACSSIIVPGSPSQDSAPYINNCLTEARLNMLNFCAAMLATSPLPQNCQDLIDRVTRIQSSLNDPEAAKSLQSRIEQLETFYLEADRLYDTMNTTPLSQQNQQYMKNGAAALRDCACFIPMAWQELHESGLYVKPAVPLPTNPIPKIAPTSIDSVTETPDGNPSTQALIHSKLEKQGFRFVPYPSSLQQPPNTKRTRYSVDLFIGQVPYNCNVSLLYWILKNRLPEGVITSVMEDKNTTAYVTIDSRIMKAEDVIATCHQLICPDEGGIWVPDHSCSLNVARDRVNCHYLLIRQDPTKHKMNIPSNPLIVERPRQFHR